MQNKRNLSPAYLILLHVLRKVLEKWVESEPANSLDENCVLIHCFFLPKKFFDFTCKMNIVSLVKTNDWLSLAIGSVYLMDTLSKQTMCSSLTGHLLNDCDENDNTL